MRTFAVVGKFDNDGGRPSKIGRQIVQELGWPHCNGGHVQTLQSLDSKFYDVLLWMPDIPNDLPKQLPRLKAQNHKLVLISSKRCGEKYTDADVVGRLLRSRSNLGIAIQGGGALPCLFRLLDPLGNIYANTPRIPELCTAIKERVKELALITRYSSHRTAPHSADPVEISEEFLVVVRRYGQQFAGFVNAINPNRYLGNAATRCALGFPAERQEGMILVSRRNVPKDNITATDFVEIRKREGMILYLGEYKPSVDAPVQASLFEYFTSIRYMIHGHVYVKGAPMTMDKLPCGAMQEFFAIIRLADKKSKGFVVNLRGHGCLIACKDLSYFDTPELIARPFLER